MVSYEEGRAQADREFMERARKLSPSYPTLEEQRVRLQKAREVFAARLLIAWAIILMISAPFSEHGVWMTWAALACFFGFAITCFVAGNRQWKRNHGKR